MSEKKKHPLGFEIIDGQLHGTLKIGMRIKGKLETRFVMREALVEDLLDAENDADVVKPLAFNAELMVRQLERVGDYDGPFSLVEIRRLKPMDWRILRAAQTELDALGNPLHPTPGNPESGAAVGTENRLESGGDSASASRRI